MAEPWHEVIEILSDSDDDQEAANTPPSDSMEDDEWIIAYRAAGMPLAVDPTEAHEGADVSSERTQEALTEDDFLTKVLEVYPDIAHEHVRQLHRDAVQKGEKTDVSWCEVIIVRILDDGLYPKERDRRRDLKRKRQPSPAPEDIVTTIWGDGHYEVGSKLYTLYATEILANEFSYVPKKFIGDTLKREITLYHAHVALEELQQKDHTPYTKVRKARHHQELSPNMPNLFKELEAAKKKIKGDTDKRLKAEKERKAEEENERVSRVEGNIAECGCCFTEYPTNRMTFCNGTETDIHFFCHECAQSYVKAEIGQGKCRPKCMDTSGCPAIFARAQLQNFLDEKTFEVLERFQQQEDLRLAGLDDMEECPFCDFKMICLPKEVDREFRCQHPDCKIVSCRLCRMETHVPLTCEQASKDKKVDVRHLVEEAMTAALVRECNKCKNKFVKEFGCNKMTCPTCGNVQCYICSKNTRSYEHFQDKPEKCPLYDNTDERHDDEVKKAEAAALEQIKKDHPELQNEDLKIEVSDAVKQVEKQRIQNGAARVPVNYAIPQQAHLVGQFAIPPVAGRPLHNVGAPHAGVPVGIPIGLPGNPPGRPAIIPNYIQPQLLPHDMPGNPHANPFGQLGGLEALIGLPNHGWNPLRPNVNNGLRPNYAAHQAGLAAVQHAMLQPGALEQFGWIPGNPVIHQYPHAVVVPGVNVAQPAPVPQPAVANQAPHMPPVPPVPAAAPAPAAPVAPPVQNYNHGHRHARRHHHVPVEEQPHHAGRERARRW